MESDYDLSDETSLAQLRAILEDIRNNAETEEIAALRPYDGSTACDISTSEESSGRVRSWHGATNSEDTELTGISQSLASHSIDDSHDDTATTPTNTTASLPESRLDDLPLAEKTAILEDMFPIMKPFDIQYALKKAKYDFSRTVEDLLNQSFLEEESLIIGTPSAQKGIDGFAEPTNTRRRKGRGKRKKQHRRTSSTPAPNPTQSTPTPPPQSSWDRVKEEIEFIAQRTNFSRQAITSAYHKSEASIPSTLTTLCSSNELISGNPYLQSAVPATLGANILELSLDFPSLGSAMAEGLIRMTYPSTASAHELARAIVTSIGASSSTFQVIPHYSPRPQTPPSPRVAHEPTHTPLPGAQARHLAQTRTMAFAQASAAYRKSKSNPLMAGAAGYYSSVGRDAAAALARQQSSASDELVNRQSRPGEVDLHGVNVKDSVRITRSKVQDWWHNGAAEWARQGKVQGDGGLRIVTGVGRHSEGGRSKIGPAVGAMLVREGWRVEVGEGTVLVQGRVRR